MTDFQQNFSSVPGQQLMPQGLFGGLLGGPLGGLIGKGIGGLFGNAGLGSQIGQVAGGIGGSLLPFSVDPMMAAYAQQQQQLQQIQQLQQLHQLQQLQQAQQAPQLQQLAPQGFFGNLLGQIGQPLGGAIGGLFGNASLGNTLGGAAGQLGRLLPFGADPIMQAYALQQSQLAPQGMLSNLLNRPLNGMNGIVNPPMGWLHGTPNFNQLQQLLPFSVQPSLQAQQGQLAPQGFFGDLIGSIGQPLGGAIGGLFGNAGLGSTIGGAAGQLGRMLPFSADPMQTYAQQGQLAPQGFFGNLIGQFGQPLGGAIGGLFGNTGLGSTIGGAAGQLGRLLPFGADPVSQAYAMQQAQLAQAAQLAPQGFFGNILGQFGQPLGSAIGGLFGNAGLGSTIGGAAGQLGRMLPFSADGFGQPYGQQFGQQFGQQAAGQHQNGSYPGFQNQQSGLFAGQPTLH